MATIVIRRMNRSDWLKTARQNATLGLPPPDATERDALETKVESEFQQAFTQQAQPIVQEADALADRLNRARTELLDVKQKLETRLPPEHLEERLLADLETERPHAVDVLKEKKRAYSHLMVFRTEHGLTHPAEKRKKPLDVFAIILLLLVIETVTNAYFYSTGVGLLHGALIAFLFSVIVAAIGFGTGFFGRYRNSLVLWERIVGWGVIVLGSVLAIYISSVTATFRALVEIARQEADRQTDLSAQSADLFGRAVGEGVQIFTLHVPFHEINATLLFGVAIIAFVNAAVAGYWAIDPVPNYSKASQRFDEAQAEVAAAETKLRGDLANAAAEMKTQRSRIVASLNDAARMHGDFTIKFERASQRYAELAEIMDTDYQQAVKECRNENAVHRAEGTRAPAFFADPIANLPIETDPLLFRNIRANLDAFKDNIGALAPDIPALNAEIVELDKRRAALAETITDHVKQWDDEATAQIEDEDGRRIVYQPNGVPPAPVSTR